MLINNFQITKQGFYRAGGLETDTNDVVLPFEVMMDIVDFDADAIKTPLEVVLSLRKETLFKPERSGNVAELSPTARDPLVHNYEFYGVAHVLEPSEPDSICRRVHEL